jgi:hypothetical protein
MYAGSSVYDKKAKEKNLYEKLRRRLKSKSYKGKFEY